MIGGSVSPRRADPIRSPEKIHEPNRERNVINEVRQVLNVNSAIYNAATLMGYFAISVGSVGHRRGTLYLNDRLPT